MRGTEAGATKPGGTYGKGLLKSSGNMCSCTEYVGGGLRVRRVSRAPTGYPFRSTNAAVPSESRGPGVLA